MTKTRAAKETYVYYGTILISRREGIVNVQTSSRFNVLCFSILLLVALTGCRNADVLEQGVVTILADDQAYQERSEPETLWYGVLGEAQRGGAPTPDRRDGLYYQLAIGSESYLLYTGITIPQLETLLEQNVVIKGKLLMPPDDVVPSEELWPATVALDNSTTPQVSGVLACASAEGQPEDKLHPVLKAWLAERSGGDRERIIVSFCDNVEIPRNPNAQEVRKLREPTYTLLTDQLRKYDAQVLETFWLINGLVVEMPLYALPELVKRQDVQHLSPEEDGSTPP